jgi:hypothetical protein
MYTETTCLDASCSLFCSEKSYELDKCLVPCPGDLLGSMTVAKKDNTITMTMYQDLLCVNDVWREEKYVVGKCYKTLDGLGYSSFK